VASNKPVKRIFSYYLFDLTSKISLIIYGVENFPGKTATESYNFTVLYVGPSLFGSFGVFKLETQTQAPGGAYIHIIIIISKRHLPNENFPTNINYITMSYHKPF
jgi:hypothetical protein